MVTIDSTEAVAKIYSRYSRFYDFFFKGIFSEGRDVALDLLDLKPGERVLEVGVGTGLSLPLYPRCNPVVGIDISPKMLEQARKKVAKHDLDNVFLLEMDAQAMTFPDDSFDCVTACYVVSCAPDPHRVVEEIRRVCKPGGRIVFINHFKSQNRLLAWFEELVNGLCKYLGWNSNLDLEALLAKNDLRISRQQRVNLFDYWRGVLCVNTK